MNRRAFLGTLSGGFLTAQLAAGCASAGKGHTGTATPPKLWFCPDGASIDFQTFFTTPEAWPSARRKVSVFKFFGNALFDFAGHPFSGPPPIILTPPADTGTNLLPNFIASDAFRKLGEWDIDIAVEWPIFFSSAGWPLASFLNIMGNVLANGGRVRYLDCDSTLLICQNAGKTRAQAVTIFKDFCDAVLAQYPDLLIGDIEPYPHFDVATHLSWLAALVEAGVPLRHYPIDVDWNETFPTPSFADIGVIGAAVRALGLPYGVLLGPGESLATDQLYHDNTLAYVKGAATALTYDMIEVESFWARAGTGHFDIPANLPETDPYTHTKLVLEIAEIFDVPDTGLPSLRGHLGWSRRLAGTQAGACPWSAPMSLHSDSR